MTPLILAAVAIMSRFMSQFADGPTAVPSLATPQAGFAYYWISPEREGYIRFADGTTRRAIDLAYHCGQLQGLHDASVAIRLAKPAQLAEERRREMHCAVLEDLMGLK